MANMFKKRDQRKKNLADEILNAGKENVNTNVNKLVNEVSNIENTNVYEDVNQNVNKNENIGNKIIIPKKEENKITTKRQTYHLTEENIEKIEKYSKEAGMGKSEFLNYFLDTTFQKLEIN